MLTFPVLATGQIANGARQLADLNRLGRVKPALGFSPGQVVIVTLPGGGDTIWVNAHEFRSLRYSPAMTRLTGSSPTPAADLNRSLATGCNYIRLRSPFAGSLQMDEEEMVQS